MSHYVNPNDVQTSAEFKLKAVVFDGGPDNGFSVAWGTWAGERRLAVRWNGSDERRIGSFPKLMSNKAAWFVLPEGLRGPVLRALLAKLVAGEPGLCEDHVAAALEGVQSLSLYEAP